MNATAPNCRCPQCDAPFALPPERFGQAISCPKCRARFVATPMAVAGPLPPHLRGASSPMAPAPGPMPPHLAQATLPQPGPYGQFAAPSAPQPAPTASLAIDRGDDVGSRRYKRSSGALSALALWIVLAGLVIVGGGILVLYLAMSTPPEVVEGEEEAEGEEEQPTAPAVRVAPTGPVKRYPLNAKINVERVHLKVESVTFGGLQFQMGNGRNGSKPEKVHLKIHVLIRNDSRGPVKYRSWYDGQWTSNETASEPLLGVADDPSQGFARSVLEGVKKIENHRAGETTLNPNDETRDTIVFEMPDGFASNPFDLDLDLPAEALGSAGVVGIRIPATAIRFE